MNLILKIVEGPNKGAEIALVEGVSVTLGKSDSCDIVLADPTLPETPVSLEPTADGVTIGGEPLVPFHVKTIGATSLAAGPADAPWEPLVWPKEEQEERQEQRTEKEGAEPAPGVSPSTSEEGAKTADSTPKKRRHVGCFGCLAAAILLLLVFAALAWIFRADPRVGQARNKLAGLCGATTSDGSCTTGASGTNGGDAVPAVDISAVAAKYGLSFETVGDIAKISGNFKTRRERLAATAEAYAVQPGVELDLSDDESLRTSSEDAIFTLTEGALKVVSATNRVVALSGTSPSPIALKKTLEALNADLPKLKNVDVSGVTFDGTGGSGLTYDSEQEGMPASSSLRSMARRPAAVPALPVCGILTTPYPCLVMKDGARILEGATIGDSVILKIEADSVTLTNSTGRVTWKP